MIKLTLTIFFALCFSGCVTIPEINAAFRRLDMAWDLEYQKMEDEHRIRIVEAPYPVVYESLRKTFLDLGMPLVEQSIANGLLLARNSAPKPLTLEEWKEVKKIEEPRMKEIGGWFFVFSDDPKSYVVTVAAAVKPVDAHSTLIVMNYEMDAPELRGGGIVPSRRAPPLAVRLASFKLWAGLNKRLADIKIPDARKRKSSDVDI